MSRSADRREADAATIAEQHFRIGLIDESRSVAAPHELARKHQQRVKMPGQRRRDESEMAQTALRSDPSTASAFCERGMTTRSSHAADPHSATLRPTPP